MSERRLPSVGRVNVSVPGLKWRPLGGLLGPARGDASQSLIALMLSATTSLITGFTIAGFESTLRTFPGLLLFIPAAIGLRGNLFGPLGGRLSTAIRTGTFSWSWRHDSVLGQNVLATMATSLGTAVGLALIAELFVQIVRADGIDPIGLSDFIVVSVFGGTIASLVVLGITLGLAVGSARFGWDLDNVTAPLVSASGDFVTLPALVLATSLIRRGSTTRALAIVFVVAAAVAVGLVVRSKLEICKRIMTESIPVLLVAGFLSLLAGLALERSIDRFLSFTVLLVILPGFLSTAGSLGGILSSRLATKMHLGLIEPARIPRGEARTDLGITYLLAVPIFVFLAVLAGTVAGLADKTSPGLFTLVGIAVTGGLVATTFVAAVAYYGTLAVVRFGLDPDNHGIPIVTASLDVVGALTFIGALLVWGVA
jgi:mgtE-like transporter